MEMDSRLGGWRLVRGEPGRLVRSVDSGGDVMTEGQKLGGSESVQTR